MANATMDRIKQTIKQREVISKTPSTDLVSITVDLYPEEIVRAVQDSLGKTVMPDYHVELYSFAWDAMNSNLPIQDKQMSGVLLTHRKVKKWLKENDVISIVELSNKAVLDAFIRFHLKNKEESEKVISIIIKAFLNGETTK